MERLLYKTIRTLLKELQIFQRSSVFCEGITFIQFNILDLLLERQGKRELKSLHTDLLVEKSTTTRLLKPLFDNNLVAKEQDPEDLRNNFILITEKGRKVHNNYWNCLKKILSGIISLIPADDREPVFDALTVIVKAVGECCCQKRCC